MIQLTLRALSVYGKKVTNSLRASEVSLNQQCSCPPGESCSVEITELPGRRFEAVVVRPRQAADNRDWAPMKPVAGMYRRLFDKRASAQRIREAVAAIVGAPLNHDGLERSAAETPTEDLKIVLVDSGTLRRARQLIVGCQVCSPYAEIPLRKYPRSRDRTRSCSDAVRAGRWVGEVSSVHATTRRDNAGGVRSPVRKRLLGNYG